MCALVVLLDYIQLWCSLTIFCFFKLGGPLSLPWGLYVLICQVRRGAYWCFRYTFTQRQNWCIEKHANLSKPSDLSQRTPEKPCLNDVSDVGTWRRAALIASVFLVVLTLIPLWDELAEELGVGLVTSFWDTECSLIELGHDDVAQFCIKISIRSVVKEHAIPIREYAMRLVQVGFARTVSHKSETSCGYATTTICDFEYNVNKFCDNQLSRSAGLIHTPCKFCSRALYSSTLNRCKLIWN